MYNRYIPQSDGSFRRSQVNDGGASRSPGNQRQPQAGQNAPPSPPPPPPQAPTPVHQGSPGDMGMGNMGGFFKGLLPQSFDTEDMIIILLLLLLGNSGKDTNATFLTLILYLFL